MIDVDESQSTRDVSPGKLLLQARLQAGLTQEQVAKDLYMTVSKIKALESDDYGRLNSHTFARGYIRAYANLLHMDVVTLLAAYDRLMDRIKPPVEVNAKPVVANESSHKGAWQFLMVIAAFLVGLWLISVWFFDNHSDKQDQIVSPALSSSTASTQQSSASSVAPIAEENVVADTRAASSGVASSAASVRAEDNKAAAIEPKPAMLAVVSSAVSSTEPIKKTGLDEIRFNFRDESWLEVSDSRGDVLATELEPAGSQLKLVGQAPFDVKLGNAPGVDVQLNGKKIELIPLMGTNVLTLKVGTAGQ